MKDVLTIPHGICRVAYDSVAKQYDMLAERDGWHIAMLDLPAQVGGRLHGRGARCKHGRATVQAHRQRAAR
jgi:hypothetical protein